MAIVTGAARDYLAAHPSRAALIVEVAESSLGLDRRFKAELYARAGLHDYWIVNLVDRALEAHRDSQAVTGDDPRAVYRAVEVLRPPATVTPLAAPAVAIPVADLLP